MQFKKIKKINLLFSIVLLLTLIFFTPVIIAEFDVFYVVKYFLLMNCNRNKYRDLINVSSCAISIIIIMVMLFGFIADYHFNMYLDYNSLAELTWLWILFYLIFRVVYCISGKFKGES